ncbi:hypothetical protein, partial [Neisseria gonorrhoeae]|uniref:hypothetical protein n=1 Tax=Neisseria gonorrhoeae TaxID=485 RepID=UPI00311F8EBB
ADTVVIARWAIWVIVSGWMVSAVVMLGCWAIVRETIAAGLKPRSEARSRHWALLRSRLRWSSWSLASRVARVA